MKVQTLIENVNLSAHVMKGGGAKVNVVVEDENGAQNVTTATIRISNLTGAASFLLNRIIHVPVKFVIGTKTMFLGTVAPIDCIYNKHERTFDLKVLSNEATVAARMKDAKLRSLLGWNIWTTRNIYNAASLTTTERWFVSMHTLLATICTSVNIGYTQAAFLDDIYMGGMPTPNYSQFAEIRLPDWSYHDLLTNICETFNCIWRVTSTNSLEILPRNDVVRNNIAAELTFPLIRDTLKIETGVVGYDIIEFFWKGPWERVQRSPYYIGYIKARSGEWIRTKAITSEFSFPMFTNDPSYGRAAAYIDADSTEVDYLVRAEGTYSNTISARSVVDGFWDCELYGTDKIQGEYSLMDATQTEVITLSNSFLTKFGDTDLQFITSAEIDWQERKASITGVRYAFSS